MWWCPDRQCWVYRGDYWHVRVLAWHARNEIIAQEDAWAFKILSSSS